MLPIVKGTIDRRILVNFRIDPEVVAGILPAPFRPKTVRGSAIGGVCLIRLARVRPRFLPAYTGFSSENAAHRFAVEWDDHGVTREGVYVPRRDTSSWFNVLVGGRLFPGVHHHANFAVDEHETRYAVTYDSDDHAVHVAIEGQIVPQLPETSVFRSLREASEFFEHGSLGYSAGHRVGEYDGLELRTFNWKVQPLAISRVESSYFSNGEQFPAGSVEFDCALLMLAVEHEWLKQPALCCEPAV